jgi:hypothetical protein
VSGAGEGGFSLPRGAQCRDGISPALIPASFSGGERPLFVVMDLAWLRSDSLVGELSVRCGPGLARRELFVAALEIAEDSLGRLLASKGEALSAETYNTTAPNKGEGGALFIPRLLSTRGEDSCLPSSFPLLIAARVRQVNSKDPATRSSCPKPCILAPSSLHVYLRPS